MKLSRSCPQCERSINCEIDGETTVCACQACGAETPVRADRVRDGQVAGCLCCPSTELFLRKDFPQKIGLSIVVVGFVGSSIAWYHYQLFLAFGILFATALIDVVLYFLMAEALVCYRCHAEYRDVANLNSYTPFSLDVHERYRQEEARMAGT